MDVGHLLPLARRHFFGNCWMSLGSMAALSLLDRPHASAEGIHAPLFNPLAAKPPHFAGQAKHVIYLFMAGGPSQLELFDNKPKLNELSGQTIPDSYVPKDKLKRFAFIKNDAKLLGSRQRFKKCGESGSEVSDLLPHLAGVVDDIAVLKTLRGENFNHGPAKMFMNTGFARPGRPGIGAWTTYGLGSAANDLPAFVVMNTGPRGARNLTQLISSGFLPTIHQGVPLRPTGDPILDLTNPKGINRRRQQQAIETIRALNTVRYAENSDPEIVTRIAAYEMAYRMQVRGPEAIDIRGETQKTLEMYGVQADEPSFARNCLLARRFVERGVRFVQLFHTDWDDHGGDPQTNIETGLQQRCQEVDRPCAALIKDLKERGLLDETLVVWGGEFGRTPQAQYTEPAGRDHHIDAFTVWLAGGGIRGGQTVGQTDDLGFHAVEDPIHVNDLHATIMYLLGLDHEKLTYRFQGREFRLTDVGGKIVKKLLA